MCQSPFYVVAYNPVYNSGLTCSYMNSCQYEYVSMLMLEFHTVCVLIMEIFQELHPRLKDNVSSLQRKLLSWHVGENVF